MTKSLVIGRFQPFHGRHIKMIDKLLNEGREVIVALRNPLQQDEINPYSFHQRYNMIRRVFPNENEVEIIPIPDITEVVHGRTPGWITREIELEEDVQHMSATKLREGVLIWLTGASGAGKTTLANELKHWFPSMINLDGDEMRSTISVDEDFTKIGRKIHNERVARLAGLLRDQGHIVVVSLICPYPEIRESVTEIAKPVIWVFIDRPSNDWRADKKKAGSEYIPYEKPYGEGCLVVNSDNKTAQESAKILFEEIAKRI